MGSTKGTVSWLPKHTSLLLLWFFASQTFRFRLMVEFHTWELISLSTLPTWDSAACLNT